MTPTAEQEFITLWQQGLSHEAMAERLGCPVGTIKSRAHRLQQQGKIEPRPRGARALAQRDAPPVETPPVPRKTPRVSRRVPERVPVQVLPSSRPTVGGSDMTPLLHDILQELRMLTQGLAGRVSPQTPQVSQQIPRVSQGVPERVSNRVSNGVSLAPREKTERWNLHLPIDLITQIKAKAQRLGVHPSELVAEVLRRWLAEETAS